MEKEIDAQFKKFDKNHDNLISPLELIEGVLEMIELDQKELRDPEWCGGLITHLIKEDPDFGKNDTQQLTKEEFAKVLKVFPDKAKWEKDRKRVFTHILFDLIDTDHSGTIEKAEFVKILTDVPKRQRDLAFQAYDDNDDGIIDLDELYGFLFN
ncbi:hypothetical protein EIN_496990 [Entamoeba invadens IP1]|uniref:EF-hand domain-containing protein n=1 Tax=Entamoeba invadens IP1 TaxID=370355 RepID=A0A0A1TZU6_ENTIV|nr:hypothetical protein EIN_496990 [Entamoeba invadens IP1]ELP87134.1 hypothetical protein EIN_496990 [Entamoeba invadens IP1]|eukprot:XP_004253905.1 hypothetical protein EIN_496990 [Entamoeba invadens IP1]